MVYNVGVAKGLIQVRGNGMKLEGMRVEISIHPHFKKQKKNRILHSHACIFFAKVLLQTQHHRKMLESN